MDGALDQDTRDREGFLELQTELPDRFGILRHAFVPMNNHYRLVIETPEFDLGKVKPEGNGQPPGNSPTRLLCTARSVQYFP